MSVKIFQLYLYILILLYSIFFIYPKAISNIIMILNPIVSPITPICDFSPLCISGINSSTTTYIIAPAANDNRYGRSGTTMFINRIVIILAIGSTTPDNTPYINAFF